MLPPDVKPFPQILAEIDAVQRIHDLHALFLYLMTKLDPSLRNTGGEALSCRRAVDRHWLVFPNPADIKRAILVRELLLHPEKQKRPLTRAILKNACRAYRQGIECLLRCVDAETAKAVGAQPVEKKQSHRRGFSGAAPSENATEADARTQWLIVGLMTASVVLLLIAWIANGLWPLHPSGSMVTEAESSEPEPLDQPATDVLTMPTEVEVPPIPEIRPAPELPELADEQAASRVQKKLRELRDGWDFEGVPFLGMSDACSIDQMEQFVYRFEDAPTPAAEACTILWAGMLTKGSQKLAEKLKVEYRYEQYRPDIETGNDRLADMYFRLVEMTIYDCVHEHLKGTPLLFRARHFYSADTFDFSPYLYKWAAYIGGVARSLERRHPVHSARLAEAFAFYEEIVGTPWKSGARPVPERQPRRR